MNIFGMGKSKQGSEKKEDEKKPEKIYPEGCGEMTLDQSLEMYSGNCQWNGEECLVHLEVDGKGASVKDVLATLKELLKDSSKWDQRARDFAALELTENANDWQEENEPEITREDFARRLTVSEVCISEEGNFEIFYNDDDMFWGHVVIVDGNLEGGIEDAYIAG